MREKNAMLFNETKECVKHRRQNCFKFRTLNKEKDCIMINSQETLKVFECVKQMKQTKPKVW